MGNQKDLFDGLDAAAAGKAAKPAKGSSGGTRQQKSAGAGGLPPPFAPTAGSPKTFPLAAKLPTGSPSVPMPSGVVGSFRDVYVLIGTFAHASLTSLTVL